VLGLRLSPAQLWDLSLAELAMLLREPPSASLDRAALLGLIERFPD
jgi:uncharacterized phage protein (TIGR02216 family)